MIKCGRDGFIRVDNELLLRNVDKKYAETSSSCERLIEVSL